MTTAKSLAVIAVAVMVLAGIGIIADASEGATGSKVTYAYDGSQIVKTTAEDGSYVFEAFADLGFEAPEGYEFKSWRDSASSAVYTPGQTYGFAGDVTVAPVFAIDSAHAEIVLTYGDVSETFVTDGSAIDADDIAAFSASAGIALTVEDGRIAVGEGEKFILKGFRIGDAEPVVELSAITGTAGETTTYEMVVEPIYTMIFVVDGVTVGTYATDAVFSVQDATKEHYGFIGWSDGVRTVSSADIPAYVATLKADTVFNAVFEPVVYDIVFRVGESSEIRSARYGGQIDAPALPEGCKAWADESGRTVAFPYTVLGPATLHAVAVPVCTVTFVSGEEVLATVSVPEGTVIPSESIPALPEGCKGWSVDLALPITADATVEAVPIVYHDVTFAWGQTAYGDKGYTVVKVEDGQLVEAPAIPEALGDVRWEVAKISAPVTADIEIGLEPIPVYSVVFMAGEETVGSVSVLEGTAIPAELIPELPEGYSSWTYAGEPVVADLTVTAVEAVAPVYTITFIVEGKAPIVQMSDSISLPDTAREGFEFQGWLVAGSSGYIDPLTHVWTQDETVTAVYREVAPAAPAEPGFLESASGRIAMVVIVFVVLVAGALMVVPSSPLYYKAAKAKAKAKADKRKAEKLAKLQEGTQEKP